MIPRILEGNYLENNLRGGFKLRSARRRSVKRPQTLKHYGGKRTLKGRKRRNSKRRLKKTKKRNCK